MVTLARFTPSILSSELLEQLFVAREHFVENVIGRIERLATTTERSHKLFVGPRGAGKTHLISLVYHRARKILESGIGPFQIAWLPEYLYTVGTLDDLLEEIIRALEPKVDLELSAGNFIDVILEAVEQNGPIVVLIENLDQVLDGIGKSGQLQLRQLMENHRPFLLIATSTRLTDYLFSQAEPFYGFFDTTTLEQFSVDDAILMLKAIAGAENDLDLVARLNKPIARCRLAAISYLAGGQPRIWALLGTGLSADKVDSLVEALITRLDDLTPYYQEQLVRLSHNERRIVRALVESDKAMNVKAIAELIGTDQRSVGKTISELRKSGWIKPRKGRLTENTDQRITFYELAEPLARLAFQIKASHGRPIPLVVDFLTAWFDIDELSVSAQDRATNEYLSVARTFMSTEPTAILRHELLTNSSLEVSGQSDGSTRLATDPTLNRYAPQNYPKVPELEDMLATLAEGLSAYQGGNSWPLLELTPALTHLIEDRLESGTSPLVLQLEVAAIANRRGIDKPEQWLARAEKILLSAADDEKLSALLNILKWQVACTYQEAARLVADQVAEGLKTASTPQIRREAFQSAEKFIRSGDPNIADILIKSLQDFASIDELFDLSIAKTAILVRLGDFQLVSEMWEDTAVKLNEANHLNSQGALTFLARTQLSLGNFNQAIELLKETLADCERILGPDHPDTLSSKNNLAVAYQESGDLQKAIELFEKTLADRELILGPDHPDTLSSKNNLAMAYKESGDLQKAIELLKVTLAGSERILGPDHPNTLSSKNNLAMTYQESGDLQKAIELFEKTLADRERILGPDHPDTLSSKNNLAMAYQEFGDLQKAIELFEKTLADSERILGPDHPDILSSKNNLAVAYKESGDLQKAIELFKETLAGSERILGPDHPNTLSSKNNLAMTYQESGDLQKAIELFKETLAGSERILGSDHPNTLSSKNNLALAYQESGDLQKAIELFEKTLADRERILGSDHPNTLSSKNNLALAYQESGDLQKAIELFEKTLADFERILGSDHPKTLTSKNNLAVAYQESGDLQKAIELLKVTLADRERILGPDHPDILSSRNNLAMAYQESGDLQKAIELLKVTLADRERILGSDHPNTLSSRNNLAVAYQESGDLQKAIELFEETLADRERILGSDHPNTLSSRNNLAVAYQESGDLQKAIELFEKTLADRERILGSDHPNTLSSKNNLAMTYQESGDLQKAIELFEKTLADRERILGSDHPNTLSSRNNLAMTYQESGDLQKAIGITHETGHGAP